jgi:hypothetical protein
MLLAMLLLLAPLPALAERRRRQPGGDRVRLRARLRLALRPSSPSLEPSESSPRRCLLPGAARLPAASLDRGFQLATSSGLAGTWVRASPGAARLPLLLAPAAAAGEAGMWVRALPAAPGLPPLLAPAAPGEAGAGAPVLPAPEVAPAGEPWGAPSGPEAVGQPPGQAIQGPASPGLVGADLAAMNSSMQAAMRSMFRASCCTEPCCACS